MLGLWNSLFFAVIISVNTIHALFYLRLKTRSPLRLLLLFIAIPAVWPFSIRLGGMYPLLGAVLPFAFFAYGVLITRLLVAADSCKCVFFCLASVLAFSQAIRMPSLLVMINMLGMPVAEAARISIIIYPVAFLLLSPFLYRHARWRFRRVLDIVETQKWYFVVPSIFLALVGNYIIFIMRTVPDLPRMSAFGILMPACVASYFVFIYMFVINHRNKELLNQLLRQQSAAAEKLEHVYDFYGKELEERENRLRTMRHDFRHLAVHLSALTETGDLPGLKRELAGVMRHDRDTVTAVFSENRTVNAVVSYHFAVAEKKGVRCTAKAFVPEEIPIPKADLSLLLGNALENCVKAASPLGERGYIAFTAKPVRDYLAFAFENNYEQGAYATGEQAGLASIRSLCERHNGHVEAEDADGVFRLKTMVCVT